jgi:hypothetical protein
MVKTTIAIPTASPATLTNLEGGGNSGAGILESKRNRSVKVKIVVIVCHDEARYGHHSSHVLNPVNWRMKYVSAANQNILIT